MLKNRIMIECAISLVGSGAEIGMWHDWTIQHPRICPSHSSRACLEMSEKSMREGNDRTWLAFLLQRALQASVQDPAPAAGLRSNSGPARTAWVWLGQRRARHHVWLPEAPVGHPQPARCPGEVSAALQRDPNLHRSSA